MDLKGKSVILHDMSLRDGMHAKAHQISLKEMVDIATGLDEAGMPMIEVTHGDGLGGASLNYGFPAHSDEEYLSAVVPALKQAKLMERYGANCIYCTGSAGYMLPADVTVKIGLLRSELNANTEIGFHGHHNLGMGIANSLAAIEAGASRIDGSVAGLGAGAGAGNTPLEVFVAVLDRMGVETGGRPL
ncbi:isopropylmalate/homocitrate/citramalate synthase [Endozoicomonas sp. NE40]|uniref:Isopropylmalate/homocitrate/citramalate synthase n=1 Tax=Endozoicomonas lisbonensis TaxID=3120522 RepID=A0ABV2SKQ8_9GAMM